MIKRFAVAAGMMIGSVSPVLAEPAGYGDDSQCRPGSIETAPNSFSRTFGTGSPEIRFCRGADGRVIPLAPPAQAQAAEPGQAEQEPLPADCALFRNPLYGINGNPEFKKVCRGSIRWPRWLGGGPQ